MAAFMSVGNIQALMGILQGYFRDVYHLDVAKCNPKILLYRCMARVEGANPDATIKEKNRLTLRKARDEALAILNSIASQPALPPAQLAPAPPPMNTRLDGPFALPQMDQFALPMQAVQPPPSQLPVAEFAINNDPPISGEDFARQLDKLQSDRQNLMERNSDMERITDDALARSGPQPHPKDIFAACDPAELSRFLAPDPQAFNGAMSGDTIASLSDAVGNGLLPGDLPMKAFSNEMPPTITKFLLINSTDRDWIHSNQRYSYRVKFTDLTDSKRKIPFYENSPVVPLTRTYGADGIPNVRGWFYEGVRYPAYNPQEPPGMLVGYETVEITAEPDSHLHNRLKDVVEISVGRVIIPMDNAERASLAMDRSSRYGLAFPYLLLNIDEISGVFDGTNDASRKAFCQLVLENEQTSKDGRGYVVLKPAQNESKVFWPTPTSALSSLTFSLRRPTGELLNQSSDGIGILGIHYDTFEHNNIKVIMSSFDSKNDLQVGDLISFKGYTMYAINDASNEGSIQRYNQYINREEGHEIVKHVETESGGEGGINAFYIRAPGAYNAKQGVFVLDDTLMRELSSFNAFHNTETEGANGFILNLSLQHTISLKVTVVKP
jgi:hypothetical protein